MAWRRAPALSSAAVPHPPQTGLSGPPPLPNFPINLCPLHPAASSRSSGRASVWPFTASPHVGKCRPGVTRASPTTLDQFHPLRDASPRVNVTGLEEIRAHWSVPSVAPERSFRRKGSEAKGLAGPPAPCARADAGPAAGSSLCSPAPTHPNFSPPHLPREALPGRPRQSPQHSHHPALPGKLPFPTPRYRLLFCIKAPVSGACLAGV